ncbi:transmembrane protein [Legionella gratiana]|uniref:Transmembrane protein n=1 Tax=Legionella gratiana TaxID=45066 RepID=A0A378J3I5_9GAMM|nr:DMT family transporter [Legionella gratiana]KTD05877.1 transmembrane protein [Legionella gratiana]STX42302.1 transmembrane protein [Legionella gratiana]
MQTFKVFSVVIIVIVLWASAFIGIRIGLTDYSPGALALLRFMIASLCLLIIYYSLGIKKRVSWKDRVQLLITGMAGIGIYNICLNYGELSVSAGIASFVIGLMPIMTVVLSFIFLQEKLKRHVWYGILISVLGLVLLTLGESSVPGMRHGVLAILVSALMGAILTIVQKQFVRVYHPVAIISWIMWGGTLLLVIFLPDLLQQIKIAHVQTTVAVVYMGIFPAALAYLAWGYALKYLSASKAAITLYALPIVSTLMGFVVLHEHPSLLSLIGCSITLLGAFIASRSPLETSFAYKESFKME